MDNDACCAHMRVRYRTQEQGSGCVSGHWECEDCFTEFEPVKAICVVSEETIEEFAGVLENNIKEALSNYEKHRFGHDPLSDEIFQCLRALIK